MAENKNEPIIQFKRGTAAELASYVPSSGEPVFATDLKLLKVGDGQNFFEDIVSPPSEASIYYVRNDTGSTIYKGQAVYASGAQASGKIITIDKYIADGTIDSRRFLGLVKEDIAHGEEGEVVHFGHVTHVNTTNTLSNINSTGAPFSEGDILYASPTTSGTLTTTRPGKAISVAFVLDAGTNGELFVRPTDEGIQSDISEIQAEYGSAVASGVYNLVIVNQDTYNNITKDPNTIYFVP